MGEAFYFRDMAKPVLANAKKKMILMRLGREERKMKRHAKDSRLSKEIGGAGSFK